MWDLTPGLYSGAYGKGLRSLMVRVFHRLFAPIQWLWATAFFARLCQQYGVAVSFSHNGGYPGGMFNRAAVIGAKLAGVRRNFMVIHGLARHPRWLTLPVDWVHDRLTEWATTGLVAVSSACAQTVKADRFITTLPLVIYNGVPVRAQRSLQEFVREDFIIGFFGELNPHKGLHILVAALPKLPARVGLRIFGKGSECYADRLQAEALALGVKDRVKFCGFVADAAEKMAHVDVVVLPSIEFESFGMVLLEAMQNRKPVVVSNIGGMKEIVQHGATGYVVTAGSEEALAGAILKLVNDRGLADRLGEAGYERLQSHFSVERMVSAYVALAR